MESKKFSSWADKWNAEYEAMKDIPLYQRNSTMFMLGKISIQFEGKLLEDYENVKAAHRDFIPYPGVYDLVRNMFLLGYVYGKRAERQRRRNKFKNAKYCQKIIDIIKSVEDEWVLEQIYRSAVNVTREE